MTSATPLQCSCKVRSSDHTPLEYRRGALLSFQGREPIGGNTTIVSGVLASEG